MKLLTSLCSRYHENLKNINQREQIYFDSVQLTYFKCHKVSLIRDSSYTDSPDWIKKKKATINPKNIDDNFF